MLNFHFQVRVDSCDSRILKREELTDRACCSGLLPWSSSRACLAWPWWRRWRSRWQPAWASGTLRPSKGHHHHHLPCYTSPATTSTATRRRPALFTNERSDSWRRSTSTAAARSSPPRRLSLCENRLGQSSGVSCRLSVSTVRRQPRLCSQWACGGGAEAHVLAPPPHEGRTPFPPDTPSPRPPSAAIGPDSSSASPLLLFANVSTALPHSPITHTQ